MTHRSSPPRTVLVVDDDPEVQGFVRQRLQERGWRVLVEKDGDWALRTFERAPIDAVVLDVLLPVRSGIEVGRRMRATDKGKRLGMVLLTGVYRDANHRQQICDELGLLAYLAKPVDVERLIALLSHHFETSGARPGVAAAHPGSRIVDEEHQAERRDVEREILDVKAKGRLDQTPFFALLARLHHDKATGALYLQSGNLKKILYVRDGHPFFAKSNVLDEALGRVLVRNNMITLAECEASVARMKAEKRLQGSILIEMGVLSPHGLRYGLDTQLRVKLFDVFHWQKGEYVFRTDVELADNVVTLDLSHAEILLEGIRQALGEDALDRHLASLLDKYLVHTSDPQIRYQRLQLSSTEKQFLDLLDGKKTLAMVLADTPPALGSKNAKALVFSLHMAGVLNTRKTRVRTRSSPPVAPSDTTAPGVWSVAPSDAPTGSISPTTPSEAPDEGDLARFLAAHQNAAPHDVLGVSADALAPEVHAAYEQLARRWHPDHFRDHPPAAGRMAAEAFALMARAKDTLLGARRANTAKRPTPVLPAPSMAQRDTASQALAADVLFRRGEARLRARAFAEAQSLFKQAAALRADQGKYVAYWGWALFCEHGQDGNAAQAALPTLEQAAKLSPGIEVTHFFLGMAYKAFDRADLAEREFEKALASNPDSVQALRELRLLHEERAKKRSSR